MTQKQKIFAGVMIIVIVVITGLIYRQFSLSPNAVFPSGLSLNQKMNTDSTPSSGMNERQTSVAETVPATPDAMVDAILDQASLDDKSLQDDAVSEKASVTASGEDINNLTQTYDENQL
jgi:hypothetical protein